MKYWKKDNVKYFILSCIAVVFLLTKNTLMNFLFPPGQNYGFDYNSVRIKLGINVLPDTWVTNDKYKNRKVWHPLNRPDSGYFWDAKEILIEDGNIIYDGDTYLHIGNEIYEQLTLTYNFSSGGDWECKYFNSHEGTAGKSITKFQADSILIDWKLATLK
ncbi:hypothetical protein ACE38W_05900 [Chitinophaga sp. Hz27]|uniref:hypothetical protein n=1 Tax=Chitinophaga sp. Hz27 TaxID=3347169 RepID=UPI0035D92004